MIKNVVDFRSSVYKDSTNIYVNVINDVDYFIKNLMSQINEARDISKNLEGRLNDDIDTIIVVSDSQWQALFKAGLTNQWEFEESTNSYKGCQIIVDKF